MDDFKWYSLLHEYSHPEGVEDDSETTGDSDLDDLNQTMIATVVIPRIVKVIESGGFDPWSSKHIRRTINLAEELEVTIDRSDHKFQVGYSKLACACVA